MKKNWQLMMVLAVSAIALVFDGVNHCFNYVLGHGEDNSFW